MKSKLSWRGCLIGCGSAILLLILLGFGTKYWLEKKQSFDVGGTVLDSEATVYLRANLRTEDAVLIEFLATQVSRLNELNPAFENYPSFFSQWQHDKARSDFRKLLPLEIEVADKASENDLRGSVGFSLYNNAAKVAYWFFKRNARKEGNLHEYKGVDYIMMPDNADDPFWLCLSHNIFYYARTEAGLRSMLDQTSVSAQSADARLADVDLNAPFYGFAIEGSIHHLLETFETELSEFSIDDVVVEGLEPPSVPALPQRQADGVPPDEPATPTALSSTVDTLIENLRRLAFDLYLKDQETLSGNLIFDMPVSDEMHDTVQALIEQLFEGKELEITYDISERPGGYRVKLEISGFQNVVKRLKAELEEHERNRREAEQWDKFDELEEPAPNPDQP